MPARLVEITGVNVFDVCGDPFHVGDRGDVFGVQLDLGVLVVAKLHVECTNRGNWNLVRLPGWKVLRERGAGEPRAKAALEDAGYADRLVRCLRH